MTRKRAKLAASSCCSAVYRPFDWYESSTLRRTPAMVSSRSSRTPSSGRHPAPPRGEKYG
jgi:hypothetical protein